MISSINYQQRKVEKRDKMLLDWDSNRAKLLSATEQNKQDPKVRFEIFK